MAIVKEITDDVNGLVYVYHKIMSLNRTEDSKVVNLSVRSYKSKKYREDEKEYKEEYDYYQPKFAQIVEIMNKPEEERTPEEQELLEGALKFQEWMERVHGRNFFLQEVSVAIDDMALEGSYSIDKCYEILKTIPPYDGAEDDD